MFGPRPWKALAAILVATLLGSSGGSAAESDLRTLLEEARAAGENAPDIARMTLTSATSHQLLAINGDVDFPLSIGIDLPITAEPRPLGAALTRPLEETGRYVLAFEVALAKVSRKVRDIRDVPSRKVVGVNKIDNPNYVRAVKQYSAYSAKIEKRPDNTKLAQLLDESRARMTTTPQYLEQPIYGDYAFKKADVEGVKTLTVNYYLVDRQTSRYLKSVFDVVEREKFTLGYGIDPSDPRGSATAADFATERQVKDWERAPVVIPLSQLLDHAQARGGPTQPAPSMTALLSDIAAERSRMAAQAAAERYEEPPLNDPRFDSVVAIYTPHGMGSGFFVRSNIVMTNWHVVQSVPIVEMRLYDRRETFGQVIAKDVRRDLALVKVQDRGRPVAFYSGKELLPGERVDAIGHPKRHLFAITRGVVSAIRRGEAKTHETQEDSDVYYIQTDAAINPGNSGGPLFKGDKVVGVNVMSGSFGQVQGEVAGRPAIISVPVPGLNFSVHYSEAKRFLDESMRGE